MNDIISFTSFFTKKEQKASLLCFAVAYSSGSISSSGHFILQLVILLRIFRTRFKNDVSDIENDLKFLWRFCCWLNLFGFFLLNFSQSSLSLHDFFLLVLRKLNLKIYLVNLSLSHYLFSSLV
ncbi:hypothetical protein ACP275_09G093700 [Erythranthe tilingii]